MKTATVCNLSRVTLFAAAAVLVLAAGVAEATPNPNSAVINERVFNDCPSSILTYENMYPDYIWIDDAQLDCIGYANLHNWRLSENGVDAAVFNNDSNFRLGATLVIEGTAEGEAGLQVSPWWSQDVDGRFNVRTTDGEIACFGGRLPFYSFTANHGLNYVRGDAIYLELTYLANGLSETSPATIEYKLTYNGSDYSSGPLPFDEGNPGEGYGSWGMLDDGRVGAHLQVFIEEGNPEAQLRATWRGIDFENLDGGVAVEESTWGRLKTQYR